MQVWPYLGSFLLVSVMAWGPVALSQPEPEQWAELVLQDAAGSRAFIVELMVYGGIEDGEVVVPGFARNLAKAAYFKVMPPGDISFLLAMNRKRPAAKKVSTNLISRLSNASFILDTSRGKWRLQNRQGNSLNTIFRAPPPKNKSATSVAKWLLRRLGYDAVVLDRDDKYLLVGSASRNLENPKQQAVAIKNSNNAINITKSSRKDTEGLLSLRKRSGSYAVFQIKFISPSSDLGRGTKLLLERVK